MGGQSMLAACMTIQSQHWGGRQTGRFLRWAPSIPYAYAIRLAGPIALRNLLAGTGGADEMLCAVLFLCWKFPWFFPQKLSYLYISLPLPLPPPPPPPLSLPLPLPLFLSFFLSFSLSLSPCHPLFLRFPSSILKLAWTDDSTRLAGAGSTGAVVFAHLIERYASFSISRL